MSVCTIQFMTMAEVGARLRISPRAMRRLVAGRKIKVVRIGRSVRIAAAALEEFCNNL